MKQLMKKIPQIFFFTKIQMEETKEIKIDETKINDMINIIKHNTHEFIGENEVREKLLQNPQLTVYWGTAPTGPPSFAYYMPLLKLKEMIHLGFHVKILLADVHSYLDKGSAAFQKTPYRTSFYILVLKSMLQTIGVQPHQYSFVVGSSYQLGREYTMDLLKFSSMINSNVATKASSEVVKQLQHAPLLSHLIYPLMQALDEHHLGADMELVGKDQRKIITFSRDHIEKKMGYSKCAYIVTPLIPSLRGGVKMSSSDEQSKLSFLDSDEKIEKKIRQAFCPPTEGDQYVEEDHPLLCILRYILFPHFHHVEQFESYEELLTSWQNNGLDSHSLKKMVWGYVQKMIAPVRNVIQVNQDLYDEAYVN